MPTDADYQAWRDGAQPRRASVAADSYPRPPSAPPNQDRPGAIEDHLRMLGHLTQQAEVLSVALWGHHAKFYGAIPRKASTDHLEREPTTHVLPHVDRLNRQTQELAHHLDALAEALEALRSL